MDESMKTELDNKSIKESVREHQAFMDEMDLEADKLAAQFSKVAIRTDGTITTVIVDGVDISKRVTKICFEHTAGAIPIVTITIPVDELTVDGSIDVAIRKGCVGDLAEDPSNRLIK